MRNEVQPVSPRLHHQQPFERIAMNQQKPFNTHSLSRSYRREFVAGGVEVSQCISGAHGRITTAGRALDGDYQYAHCADDHTTCWPKKSSCAHTAVGGPRRQKPKERHGCPEADARLVRPYQTSAPPRHWTRECPREPQIERAQQTITVTGGIKT